MNIRTSKNHPHKNAEDAQPSHILFSLPSHFMGNLYQDLSLQDGVKLSSVCRTLYHFFKSKNDNLELIQCVIDNDIDRAQLILKNIENNPSLLLELPSPGKFIQSKYTWQKFKPERPLTMAYKRRQNEMVKFLIPYFYYLEEKKKLKSASAEISAQMQGRVPDKIYDFDDLIRTLSRELFIHGNEDDRLIDCINKDTELALKAFREKLLPDGVINLDTYFDIEASLYSAYNTYESTFFDLDTDQANLFCIAVIGFLQSLLPPELVRKYYEHIEKNQKNDSTNNKLILLSSFYRRLSGDKYGIGYNFMYSTAGQESGNVSLKCSDSYKKLCDANSDEHVNIKRNPEGYCHIKKKIKSKIPCSIQ